MVSDREVMQAMLTMKTYCDEHRFCKECRPAKMQGCPNIAGNAPYVWSSVNQRAVDALDDNIVEDK